LGDNTYSSTFSSTFTNAQSGSGGHPNFENMYYDDTGWWALAWIDAYDLTANSSYLSMAETIFNYETGGWKTNECGGGGMNWSTASTYQNAVTNELFLTLAAKLANRTTGSTSTTYRNWANNEWNWFMASGMINSQNLINDGLHSVANGCGNNNAPVWSYNQGVILDGLVELARANNDPSLIAKAQMLANAVLNSYGTSTPLVDTNGILTENQPLNGNTDIPQFKGVFARNLAALYSAAPVPAYKTFLDNNANSIWNSDRTLPRNPPVW
jgi:predicted alpha-1,6-mannanase (GH76 family)